MGVVVTNRNESEFVGRFDGVKYAFPPGESVEIPDIAAGFIFGFGKSDSERSKVMIRQGWQRTNVPGAEFGPEYAEKIMGNFVFGIPKKTLTLHKQDSDVVTHIGKKAPLAHPAKAA